jgi:hypothetical protein
MAFVYQGYKRDPLWQRRELKIRREKENGTETEQKRRE